MEKLTAEKEINKMISQLGLASEYQLCSYFKIDGSLTSKWKARGRVPSRYIEEAESVSNKRKEGAALILKMTIPASEVAEVMGLTMNRFYQVRKKRPELCEAVEAGLKLLKNQ